MKEHPITFSGPMVCAILDGSKTQTRRVLKPQPDENLPIAGAELVTMYGDPPTWCWLNGFDGSIVGRLKGVKYAVGDHLWVREAWRASRCHDDKKPINIKRGSSIYYEAGQCDDLMVHGKLRPSIFMPRWASRITLKVTDVRVERLQDISVNDVFSEGIERPRCLTDQSIHMLGSEVTLRDNTLNAFRTLWDSINGKKHPWDSNPWVVAYTFERINQ